eukprot:11051078-Alexandrium_andersonii.AAC.1
MREASCTCTVACGWLPRRQGQACRRHFSWQALASIRGCPESRSEHSRAAEPEPRHGSGVAPGWCDVGVVSRRLWLATGPGL